MVGSLKWGSDTLSSIHQTGGQRGVNEPELKTAEKSQQHVCLSVCVCVCVCVCACVRAT